VNPREVQHRPVPAIHPAVKRLAEERGHRPVRHPGWHRRTTARRVFPDLVGWLRLHLEDLHQPAL